MVVVHSAGLIAIDVTPLSMIGDCWWHGERQLARESAAIPWRALAQSQGSGRHEESQEVILRMNSPPGALVQITLTDTPYGALLETMIARTWRSRLTNYHRRCA